MDREKKLRLLARLAVFECDKSPDFKNHIYEACTPRGKTPLLKIMQATHCDRNCDYCVFRRDRDQTPRIFIKPEDLAKGFYELYSKGRVNGLFLSSGIFIHPEITMEKMIDTVKILREKYDYRGYVHLKLMPGVSTQTIEEAVKVADRVSFNIEAPSEERLKKIARSKSLRKDMIPKMAMVSKLLKDYEGKSQITQVMVGTSDETDYEILRGTQYLYRKLGLARVYYSAFFPVPHTPMECRKPESSLRENRLYQADFLIRDYGFSVDELPFENGRLPQNTDPKTAWAIKNAHLFPVEINTADYETLIRVPGIGPKSAKEIIRRRRSSLLRSPSDLKGLRNIRKMKEFLTFRGIYYGSLLKSSALF